MIASVLVTRSFPPDDPLLEELVSVITSRGQYETVEGAGQVGRIRE
jgi:hypothetical protein